MRTSNTYTLENEQAIVHVTPIQSQLNIEVELADSTLIHQADRVALELGQSGLLSTLALLPRRFHQNEDHDDGGPGATWTAQVPCRWFPPDTITGVFPVAPLAVDSLEPLLSAAEGILDLERAALVTDTNYAEVAKQWKSLGNMSLITGSAWHAAACYQRSFNNYLHAKALDNGVYPTLYDTRIRATLLDPMRRRSYPTFISAASALPKE